MKPEDEIEVSDELKSLKEVSREISQHTKRLDALKKKGALSEDLLGTEITSTVLPLLEDLAKASLMHAAFMEEWVASVEDVVGDEGPEPDLSDEEIEILQFLLARLRDFLQGASSAEDIPPQLRQGFLEIEVKLNKGEKILARLVEDGEEEDEEGDPDEDADDEDTSDAG